MSQTLLTALGYSGGILIPSQLRGFEPLNLQSFVTEMNITRSSPISEPNWLFPFSI